MNRKEFVAYVNEHLPPTFEKVTDEHLKLLWQAKDQWEEVEPEEIQERGAGRYSGYFS